MIPDSLPEYRPVYRAVHRPLTVAGVDRRLFFMAVLVGAGAFNLFADTVAPTLLGKQDAFTFFRSLVPTKFPRSDRPLQLMKIVAPQILVGATGFEPATPCAQDCNATISCDFLRLQISVQPTQRARVRGVARRIELRASAVVLEPRWNPAAHLHFGQGVKSYAHASAHGADRRHT
jgi:hypothetical protein